MGILFNLFATSAIIRFEGYDSYGKKWVGKSPIKYFGNIDEHDIIEKLQNHIFVEKGVIINNIKIIGYSDTY